PCPRCRHRARAGHRSDDRGLPRPPLQLRCAACVAPDVRRPPAIPDAAVARRGAPPILPRLVLARRAAPPRDRPLRRHRAVALLHAPDRLQPAPDRPGTGFLPAAVWELGRPSAAAAGAAPL